MSMKFYDDDGTEINPDLIPKPDLCIPGKRQGLDYLPDYTQENDNRKLG